MPTAQHPTRQRTRLARCVFATIACAALFAAAWAFHGQAASADELETRSGAVYQGRVIEQTDRDVTFEMVHGDGKARVTFPRSVIRSVKVSPSSAPAGEMGTPASAPASAPASVPASAPASQPASAPAHELKPTPTPRPTPRPTPTPTSAPANNSPYADGVYTGSHRGHKSVVELQITVRNGRLTEVRVTKQDETPHYWNRAKVLVDRIGQSQGTTGVDTVSGATRSSRAILRAAEKALEKAKKP